MCETYSRYKSALSINPHLESWANDYINTLGSSFVLEGVTWVDQENAKITWRDSDICAVNKWGSIILPVKANSFGQILPKKTYFPSDKHFVFHS